LGEELKRCPGVKIGGGMSQQVPIWGAPRIAAASAAEVVGLADGLGSALESDDEEHATASIAVAAMTALTTPLRMTIRSSRCRQNLAYCRVKV